MKLNTSLLSWGPVYILLAVMIFPAAGLAETTPFEPLNPALTGPAGRRTPVVAAIEKARPAVISVYAQVVSRGGPTSPFGHDPFADEFFNRFFSGLGPTRTRKTTNLGSGVIIDGTRGLALTNDHVLRGAASITVALADGREAEAEVLGTDPRHDLAVLKIISGQTLPQLPLGDSEGLMIGETVIAIGNPFGLSHTATVGIVSATGREVPLGDRQGDETLKDLIQTDAAINPGNSGGPLINLSGEVVGINTAIIRGDGLGFAIPSGQAGRILARLLRGDAGADLDLGLELAEAGRPRRGATGCLVIGLADRGPAEAAGLLKGDLLLRLDGSAVDTLADYQMVLTSLVPGQAVTAEVNRDGRSISLSLAPRRLSTPEILALGRSLFGLAVSERRGQLVLEKPPDDSPAAKVGLREGDLLIKIGDHQLTKAGDLASAVLENRFHNTLILTIQRGRSLYQARLNR